MRSPGNGPAAFPEVDHHPLGAGNEDRDLVLVAAVGEGRVLLRRLRVPGRRREAFRHQARGSPAETDIGEELVAVVETKLLEDAPSLALRQLSQREVLAPQRLVEQPPPEVDRLVAVEPLEVAADVGPRLAGDDEVDPGGIGPGPARGHDFHRLAGGERRAERSGASVDASRLAGVPDVRVDRVREVDGGGPARELEDLPGRG